MLLHYQTVNYINIFDHILYSSGGTINLTHNCFTQRAHPHALFHTINGQIISPACTRRTSANIWGRKESLYLQSVHLLALVLKLKRGKWKYSKNQYTAVYFTHTMLDCFYSWPFGQILHIFSVHTRIQWKHTVTQLQWPTTYMKSI